MTSQVTYEDAPSPTMHLRSRCEWRAATGHRCIREPHSKDVLHEIELDDGERRAVSEKCSCMTECSKPWKHCLKCGGTGIPWINPPAPPRPSPVGNNIAATLNRLSALEEKAAALVTLANAQGETNAAVEARLDALERAAKRGGCDGACASGVDAENAHAALDAAGIDGADERGDDLSLSERVALLVAARDAAREAAASLQSDREAEFQSCDNQRRDALRELGRTVESGKRLKTERDAALAQYASAIQAGEALRIECDALTAQVDSATAALHTAEQSLATTLRERDEARHHLNPPAEGTAAEHATADSATGDAASPRPTCGSLPCYSAIPNLPGTGFCLRRGRRVAASDGACSTSNAGVQ